MDISVIEARDLPEAWFLCLRKTLIEGSTYTIDRGSYVGHIRKELDFVVVKIVHPGNRPIIPDVPPGVPPPASMDYIESYLPYLMTSEKKVGEQYTYGQFLEPQIEKVIKMYKQDGPNTNQAYMAVGDAKSIDLEDPPCLRGIDTKIRNNKLHFFVYFRSWDLWAGFPSNLGGIQLLKEYMASEIGVEDGEIIAISKGLHLYKYSWEQAQIGAQMINYHDGQLPLDIGWDSNQEDIKIGSKSPKSRSKMKKAKPPKS